MIANAFVHTSLLRRSDFRPLGLPTVWSALLAAAILSACSTPQGPQEAQINEPAKTEAEASSEEIGRHGGRLVLTMRAEPKSFNPLTAFDSPSLEVLDFLNADLMHLDRASQEVRPAIALGVDRSEDGRRYTMHLRPDLRFSDGEPFDAEDVLFTYRTLLDPEIGAPQRETLLLDGEPLALRSNGPLEVVFELPRGHAGGESLFDRIYLVPEHKLGGLDAESLAGSWAPGTDLSEVVGLGPFRLREHRPGERLVLERNPHYWRRDAEGGELPYLDEIVIEFTASVEANTLRFEAGQSDILEGIAADAFAALEKKAGPWALRDLGPGLVYEFLFFNLNDVDSPALQKKQKWFRNLAFRQALSLAIDRRAIAELVYGGRATPVGGHITPANRRFYDDRVKAPEVSIDEARARLEGAGFRWQEEQLFDADGAPVELTLVTNSSNNRRVETATVIQDDLQRLGISLQVVPLDFGALLDRVYESFDYEIGLLGLGRGGLDPNVSLNVWLSSGDSHLWRLNGTGPDSPWQERLDALLHEQMVELDVERRRALVGEIQGMIAEEAPFVFLVAPNVLVAAKNGLGGFSPTPVAETAAWNADRLFWHDL